MLSEKKILNETKYHNHPLQVKWSVPNTSLKITDINRIINYERGRRGRMVVRLLTTYAITHPVVSSNSLMGGVRVTSLYDKVCQ